MSGVAGAGTDEVEANLGAIEANQTDGSQKTQLVDSGGNEIVQQKTAFGELSTAELSPIVQVQFPYNINTDIWEIRDNNGTSSVSNNLANLSTGADTNQSSTILSRVPIKYNPGQGGLCRFTALYTAGVANSTQYAGIGNSTDGYFFGYNGATFGILRRQGGKPKVSKFEITTKSSTDENITITLDGDAEGGITVTNGADVTVTANEIAAHDFSNVGDGWEVHSMGKNVFFTSFSDGAKTGTFEITTSNEAAATVTEPLAGVSATETIVTQTNWNKDTLDGSSDGNNPSEINLDQTKGNVYQIRYQWLGFGAVEFWIEHGADGELHLVHILEYANANTVPSVDNPTLPLYASAKNTSNASNIVLKIGSMGGFVEGRDTLRGLPHSLTVEKAGVTTTETPIMTIHAHDIYRSTINRVRSRFTLGSVSIDGNKPGIVRIRLNATLVAGSFSPLNSNTSVINIDTSATSVSDGTLVFAEGIPKAGATIIDLDRLGIDLVAPDFLTLSIEATGTNIDTVSTLNWQELF